jgi:hypothetical protein
MTNKHSVTIIAMRATLIEVKKILREIGAEGLRQNQFCSFCSRRGPGSASPARPWRASWLPSVYETHSADCILPKVYKAVEILTQESDY